MSDPWPIPSPAQIDEIYRIARSAAAGAGASGEDLDDVSQNVAERLTKKWNEPHVVEARSRTTNAWQAYVVVVARNAYRDFLRRERRLKAREDRASRTAEGGNLPFRPNARRPLDQRPSNMDEYLARRLMVDLIEECFEGRARLVATYTFMEGLSTREISALLGMSIRSVNQHKVFITERLRTRLRVGAQGGSDWSSDMPPEGTRADHMPVGFWNRVLRLADHDALAGRSAVSAQGRPQDFWDRVVNLANHDR